MKGINNYTSGRDYNYSVFRDKLEKWADDNGIKSVKELAKRIGYSESFCSSCLRGTSIPSKVSAVEICYKIGIPLEEILTKADGKAPAPKAPTKEETKTYTNSICPVKQTVVKTAPITSSAKWKIGLTVDESSSRPNVCVTLTKFDQVVGYKYAEIKTDKGIPENEAVAQAISYAMHWIYKMEQDKSFRKGGQR